ncbi:hypothetical protein [Pseudoalteromonas luteoviolacea]|uniref:hypothetical protein n=1 Tax=Pseudoalteromonas luteoviolacea TaxID=43657 RepID=UPI00114E1A6C|nr:hypothetical protein [Pseudoalteromonas luteoviolacea]TQF67630.1 hypothetical protein FLM44_20830 [Pseudoalteromonas luteoviolacea]
MGMLVKVLILVFTTSMFGCVTPNLAPKFELSADSGAGIVWGTITYEGQYNDFQLFYINNNSGEIGYVQADLIEMQNARGGIFAVSLPAGSYTLTGWRISEPYLSVNFSQRGNEFVSESGIINYIGNVHFTLQARMNMAEAGVIYQNYIKRDKQLIVNRYPSFDIEKLKVDNVFLGSTFCSKPVVSENKRCTKSIVNTPVR